MLKEIHRSHIGIGGCLRRAREVLYWPRINAEVKEYVSKCSICQSYQPEQCREELQPHEMPSRSWSKVGADIFELGPQHFLIMVDYWSSYFEVQELKRIKSESLIYTLKVQFARHGIPEVHRQRDTIKLVVICKIHLKPALSSVERKSRECPQSLQRAAEESTSRQQRSSVSVLRLEKHPVRRSRNLTGSTSDGQKNTNAVANSHQTAKTKSRQPDRRQVG